MNESILRKETAGDESNLSGYRFSDRCLGKRGPQEG